MKRKDILKSSDNLKENILNLNEGLYNKAQRKKVVFTQKILFYFLLFFFLIGLQQNSEE